MDYSLTIFKNKYDTRTHKRMDFQTWKEFENLLYELSNVEKQGKEDACLISPATFAKTEDDLPSAKAESDKRGSKPFIHRKNINVVDWGGWIAVDVDEHDYDYETLEETLNDNIDYNFICYSTASSSSTLPKFRLIFPCNRRIHHEEIRSIWWAISQELQFDIDAQCKDLARMYYVPGNYYDSCNFMFSSNNSSSDINVDDLILKHPAPKRKSNSFFDNLPENVQNEIIEHRKKQLENTDVHWTSYRNCKFWPKKLAAEYVTISDTGWYHKLYQIMLAIASNAIRNRYPITAIEIAQLCFEFDADNGGWYKERPLETEANRALEYAYRNTL